MGKGSVLLPWVRREHKSSATPRSAKPAVVVVDDMSVPASVEWARRARSVDLSADCSFLTAQQTAASRQRGVAGRSVIVRTARRPRSRRRPGRGPGDAPTVSDVRRLGGGADRSLDGQSANLGLTYVGDHLAALGVAVDVLLARQRPQLE